MKKTIYLLWLEGIDPEIVSSLPSVNRIQACGIDLRLTPLPVVEKEQCYYQVMTGMGSGKFGRFDVVRREGYSAQYVAGLPDTMQGRTLPELLCSCGLMTTTIEPACGTALKMLAHQPVDFVLLRLQDAGFVQVEAIDALIQSCYELMNPLDHILVLTDVWVAAPHALVNVNDFLADAGLLEVSTARRREDIAWSETLAYGLGSGQIWINLYGREPQGIVHSGREYQDVCAALIDELSMHWRDPRTNEPVVEHIFTRDELYSGEYLFMAPDLITVYRSGYAPSAHAMTLDLDGVSVRAVEGVVRQNAVPASYARLIGCGPSLAKAGQGHARLIDVAPTVMYLLGQPVPGRMDGTVISSICTTSYLQQMPIKRIDDDELLSSEEEELVVDRLRNLGYLG